MKTQTKRKIINIVLVLIIFFIFTFLGIEEIKELNVKNKNYDTQNISTKINNVYDKEKIEDVNKSKNEENENIKTNYEKEEIIKEYKGYDVLAKLEIPKINLETYVLKTYSSKALEISVVKFWGAEPNTIGNFCIAGHNFKNKNMFHNLKELNIGDNLFIIDNNIGKVEYEIYNIYKVYPEDVSSLSQETQGEKQVTLITCTNNSSKRIIVKAREKE